MSYTYINYGRFRTERREGAPVVYFIEDPASFRPVNDDASQGANDAQSQDVRADAQRAID